MIISNPFEFGQKVMVDGDQANVVMIVAIICRKSCEPEFDCSYWHQGEQKMVLLPMWRLSAGE